jgi:hypothetical protein
MRNSATKRRAESRARLYNGAQAMSHVSSRGKLTPYPIKCGARRDIRLSDARLARHRPLKETQSDDLRNHESLHWSKGRQLC